MSADPRPPAELPDPGGAERDGIGEDDHAIPVWFNLAFYASILFGVVYIFYYDFSGWTQLTQYEVAAARSAAEKPAPPAAPTANPYKGDAAAIAEGKEVFTTICAACHLADGHGLVGPSLVDPYWKYGGDDATLFETVSKGRPGGMPPWGAQLGPEKIWKALAYLATLPKASAPGVGAPDYRPPGAAGGR